MSPSLFRGEISLKPLSSVNLSFELFIWALEAMPVSPIEQTTKLLSLVSRLVSVRFMEEGLISALTERTACQWWLIIIWSNITLQNHKFMHSTLTLRCCPFRTILSVFQIAECLKLCWRLHAVTTVPHHDTNTTMTESCSSAFVAWGLQLHRTLWTIKSSDV